MGKAIEAIYDNGVFRPLSPVKGLKKRQKVQLTLLTPKLKKHPLEGLCGILPDDDAKEMLNIIHEEFEKVDINDW